MALRPLPQSFAATREALHEVAERIVATARKPDNEIALEAAQGGFGTPAFEYEAGGNGSASTAPSSSARLTTRSDGRRSRASARPRRW